MYIKNLVDILDITINNANVNDRRILSRVGSNNWSDYLNVLTSSTGNSNSTLLTEAAIKAILPTSDHGSLSGLADDDHTQYHNATRATSWLAAGHETTYNHTNYNTAYSWGDHAGLYSLKNHNHNSVYALLIHDHDTVYAPIVHNHSGIYAPIVHNHSGIYEPVFSKNTAFNKNFGTSADTVAEGNHTHASTSYWTQNGTDIYYNSGNVAIGKTSASQALDITGKIALNDGGNSVFIGTYAGLYDDASNNRNVGIGYGSLYSNTTGNQNTANGYQSLQSNTTGNQNTANGYQSLQSNTTGYYNTANGYQSLYSNTTGYYNTANGYQSLYCNKTGYYNTANGYRSLYSNTTGKQNTANGYHAGRYIADGTTANTTGDYNVFLGTNTRALADNDQNEIVIGYNAIGNGSNTVTIGNTSITDNYFQGTVHASELDVNGNLTLSSTSKTIGTKLTQSAHALNSVDVITEYSNITTELVNVNTLSEHASLTFKTMHSGSLVEAMSLQSGVVNCNKIGMGGSPTTANSIYAAGAISAGGNMLTGGTLTTSGVITAGDNILPDVTNANDLGATDKYFKALYTTAIFANGSLGFTNTSGISNIHQLEGKDIRIYSVGGKVLVNSRVQFQLTTMGGELNVGTILEPVARINITSDLAGLKIKGIYVSCGFKSNEALNFQLRVMDASGTSMGTVNNVFITAPSYVNDGNAMQIFTNNIHSTNSTLIDEYILDILCSYDGAPKEKAQDVVLTILLDI